MDRTKIPVIREAREVDYILPECKQVWFDNGVPLYYINQGSQEVISLDIVFPAGEYYQPKRGVARAAAALFRSGTSARTAIEVDEAIEQYGANLKAGVNADRVFINLTCLSKFADPLISLIAELIQDTGYDESELELYRARMKQSLSIQLQKTDFVANRLIDEKIFGFAHPYGTYMAMDDYESLQRQDLLSFREKNYQIRNAKIFLAGKFEETKLVGTLQKHFGGMEEIETGEEPDYPILPADIKRYKENIGNEGVQGSVRVGRLFVDKDHEDYTPFQFVNMLFGGFFGSRLMRNIREEKGFTYGIYSYIPALVH